MVVPVRASGVGDVLQIRLRPTRPDNRLPKVPPIPLSLGGPDSGQDLRRELQPRTYSETAREGTRLMNPDGRIPSEPDHRPASGPEAGSAAEEARR